MTAGERPYGPVSCAVHDRLEASAVLGHVVQLIHRTTDGSTEAARARILDVYAESGAESLLVEDGQRIRLDRIVEFSGPGGAPVVVARPSPKMQRSPMSSTGLAVFVFLAFLVPVPLLVWLDRPRDRSRPTSEQPVYAGHFAAAAALKAREPDAPFWGLLIGVGVLDLLFAPFVLLGIERASITPEISPGFSLDHIDWSHSLLMSLVWSLVFAALFWRRGGKIAALMGFAVFSHFLLDLPMHPPDLAVWPGAEAHLGFGLWRALPTGWWWVEFAVIVAACGYYVARARSSAGFGGRPVAVAVVIVALHVFNSPWLSPL